METTREIEVWFEVNKYGCLVLPDGHYYGGPFDIHRLDSVGDDGVGTLELVLDGGRMTLHFSRLLKVRLEGRDLVLAPFCEFTTRRRTSKELTIRTFASGEVRFRPVQGVW